MLVLILALKKKKKKEMPGLCAEIPCSLGRLTLTARQSSLN